jgi:amino acid transporter
VATLTTTTPNPTQPEGLAKDSLGLRDVVFQSITSMAPAGAIAFSIAVGASFAGGALTLALVLAGIACVLTALSIGQLSKQMPSAGSFFTYTSRSLHPYAGFVAGWAYFLAVAGFMPALLLLLGAVGSQTLHQEIGLSAGLWWIWVVGGAGLVFALNYTGIKITERVNTYLGGFEILVFIALGLTMIIRAHHNTPSVFTTHYATVPGFRGFSGIFAALIFALLAFVGFEEAAPLAEETRDARHAVGRAVLLSVVAIGLVFVFVTYGATAYFGPSAMPNFQAFGGGNPYQQIAHTVWGAGWVAVFVALINSGVACANASMAAASRTAYAMARIKLLPAPLGRLHPRHKTPVVALAAQLVVGLGVALWLGARYDPLTGYALIGTFVTVIIIAIYMLMHASSFFYYARFRRSEFRPDKHIVVPVLGIAILVPAILTAAGITAFKFIQPLPSPIKYAAPAALIWALIGVAVLVYLVARHPERINATKAVFGGGPQPVADSDEPLTALGTQVK